MPFITLVVDAKPTTTPHYPEYVDLQNDVYFHRIADLIGQVSSKSSTANNNPEPVGHLGRNIASESEATLKTQQTLTNSNNNNNQHIDNTLCSEYPEEIGEYLRMHLTMFSDLTFYLCLVLDLIYNIKLCHAILGEKGESASMAQ